MIERVYAQQALQDLAPNPGLSTFGMLVNSIVLNAFMLAGVLSFILLIFGGFQVIVSSGDAKKAEQGKAALTAAVTGLVLVLGSFLLVEIIGVITGLDLLNPGV